MRDANGGGSGNGTAQDVLIAVVAAATIAGSAILIAKVFGIF